MSTWRCLLRCSRILVWACWSSFSALKSSARVRSVSALQPVADRPAFFKMITLSGASSKSSSMVNSGVILIIFE